MRPSVSTLYCCMRNYRARFKDFFSVDDTGIMGYENRNCRTSFEPPTTLIQILYGEIRHGIKGKLCTK